MMNRDHVKGAADKAKGAIKDAAGKITGDKELQTEGKIDKAKGTAHNVARDVKDAVRKADEAAEDDSTWRFATSGRCPHRFCSVEHSDHKSVLNPRITVKEPS
jgi:uncharacterized protein YjbJ (UPF0337 family)